MLHYWLLRTKQVIISPIQQQRSWMGIPESPWRLPLRALSSRLCTRVCFHDFLWWKKGRNVTCKSDVFAPAPLHLHFSLCLYPQTEAAEVKHSAPSEPNAEMRGKGETFEQRHHPLHGAAVTHVNTFEGHWRGSVRSLYQWSLITKTIDYYQCIQIDISQCCETVFFFLHKLKLCPLAQNYTKPKVQCWSDYIQTFHNTQQWQPVSCWSHQLWSFVAVQLQMSGNKVSALA